MQLNLDDLLMARYQLDRELSDLQDAIDDPDFHGNDVEVLSLLNSEKRNIEVLLAGLELAD